MAAALPIALFYFCSFGALGLSWPYLSLFLSEHGLSATQVTLVLAISPALSIVTPPLVGLAADARRARVWLLRGCALAAALAFAGFLRPSLTPAALVATFFGWALFRSPQNALADAAAVDGAARGGTSYGAIRLWGSLGFLLAVASGGTLIAGYGFSAMALTTTVALALTAACAFAVPAPPVAPRARRGARSGIHRNEQETAGTAGSRSAARLLDEWRALASARDLWIFLAALALAQAGGASYDACFTLYLARLGHGPRFVAAAWSIGVGAEVVLLALSGRIVARVGGPRLFTLSAAIAALRWLLLPRLAASPWLLLLQPLHGVSFGLLYSSSVTVVAARGRAAPTAAQGLLAAAWSVGAIAGMSLSGALLDRLGGRALFELAAASTGAGALLGAWYQRAAAPRALAAAPLARSVNA
jgi:PPP family 3-phenylpropionic acid transporter